MTAMVNRTQLQINFKLQCLAVLFTYHKTIAIRKKMSGAFWERKEVKITHFPNVRNSNVKLLSCVHNELCR